MFFAITALAVSAIQIAVGIAIGLALRKQRQRRLAACGPADFNDTLPVEWPTAEGDGQLSADSAASFTTEADSMTDGLSRPESATELRRTSSATPAPVGKPAAATRDAAKKQSKKAAPESVDKPPQKNRRMSPRRPFQYRQQVAPYHGGLLPGKASFREVECQDISSTGFSFLSSQLPDFDSIVVALGVAPQQVYLWAHIVSRFPLNDGPAPLYRIGCRFVGPVNQ